MKMFIQLSLILLAFCVVATALLAYVNTLTKPKIEAILIKEAQVAREALIPNADFEEVNGALTYYIARDKATKEIMGYTFTAEKIGYNGLVKTMAAVDKSFNLINIQIVQQTETPGLGTNSTKPVFTDQFKGKTVEQLVVDKDGGVLPNAIKALTGATITSRAITASLKEHILLLQQDIQNKPDTPTTEGGKP